MGERVNGIDEVKGSSPFRSTPRNTMNVLLRAAQTALLTLLASACTMPAALDAFLAADTTPAAPATTIAPTATTAPPFVADLPVLGDRARAA